ncbi:MAG: hypothetical protein J6T01_03640 [Kiritimatiellae bacterium]|nr:hypothetical protein [Kiritimatiellia bacterium]
MTDLAAIVFDRGVSPADKRRAARKWLRRWQLSRLPSLRSAGYAVSRRAAELTAVIYFFTPRGEDFAAFEFAVLQTWRVIGKTPVVIVADRAVDEAERFREAHADFVSVQIEPSLRPGDIRSMTADCIERLHRRFETPYCLTIQDDGFPVSDALDRFLGAYDYIGAPSVRDVPAQYIVDITRCACMNGGFSLRSRRICRDVAGQWRFWRRFVDQSSPSYSEDVVYSQICCRNPLFRLRNRFPSSRTARRFSLPDFDGAVDIRNPPELPFGVHGPTAVWQLASCGAI